MAEQRSGTHQGQTHPTPDRKKSEGPGNAGAHGAPEGETNIETASGMSGSKGVSEVGDPAMPTGGRGVGQPSKYGVMVGGDEHTLQGQLREKGFVSDEGDAGEKTVAGDEGEEASDA